MSKLGSVSINNRCKLVLLSTLTFLIVLLILSLISFFLYRPQETKGSSVPLATTISPSVVISDSSHGVVAWTNPQNAVSSNNTYSAVDASNNNQESYYLKATGFGFSIPSGSKITGIRVEVEAKRTSNSHVYNGNGISLVKGGIVQGADRSNHQELQTIDTYEIFGNSEDLWGLTWSPADVNANNFGVVYSAFIDTPSPTRSDAYVDHIRITVFYIPKEQLPKCDGGPSGEIFPLNKWYSCYYQGEIDTANFLGSETITPQALNLNWGTGEIYGGLSENISASFRRIVSFEPGYYKFTIESDDAIDLWVDTYHVYKSQDDLYRESGYNSYTSELIYLKRTNPAPVVVLWHESTGSAFLKLSWQKVEVQEKTSIGIDANISGNTAASLDVINSCVSVSSGQIFDVDLFIKDVNLISSQGISLKYDPSLLEVMNINSGMFLVAYPESSLFNRSDINNNKGYSLISAADTNTTTYQSVESGSGVLARITLKSLASGIALLEVTPKDVNQDQILDYGPSFSNAGGYRIRDVDKNEIFDGSILNAVVAINQPCIDDLDNDGFSNEKELYLGTDPLDACPDNSSDPAWPLDMNNDKLINLGGDVLRYIGKIGAKQGDPNYDRRLDLNADGLINLGGDVSLFTGKMGQTCQ